MNASTAIFTPAMTDAELVIELRAVLRDIAMGAEMMLQPACNVTGAMRGYVQEVKRVATAGSRL